MIQNPLIMIYVSRSVILIYSNIFPYRSSYILALVKLNEPVQFTKRGLLRPICLPPPGETFDGDDVCCIY